MALSIERFAELLDAYGADLRRWPSATTESATDLLSREPTARHLLQQAQALDGALQVPTPAPVTALLRQRILHSARLHATQRKASFHWRELLNDLGGWRLAAPSMAAALGLGVALGFGLGFDTLGAEPESTDLVALLQLDEQDLEF